MRRTHAEAERSDFKRQERRLVDALPGGVATPGSGSSHRPSHKSDGVGRFFRGEAKTTENVATITLERAAFAKIEAEALPSRAPALTFGWDTPRAPHYPEREDWIAFRLSDGKRMMRVVDALKRGELDEARAAAEMIP